MTTQKKIEKIADTYGYDAQSRQCIEEMAELTQAINKHWRNTLECGKKSIEKTCCNMDEYQIIEEIADVQIMLWQMMYMLDGANNVTCVINDKLDRQIKRIEEEDNEVD